MCVSKRLFLYAAIALYVAAFILSMPYPNNMNVYATLSVLTIPVQTTDGLYMAGIFSLVMLVGSIVCFVSMIKKWKWAAVVLPLVLFLVLPSVAIPMYQAYIAQGIQAIHYDEGQSGCQATLLQQGDMQLYCELTLHNYSDEDVQASVEFVGQQHNDALAHWLNEAGPYDITIRAEQTETIVIDQQIVAPAYAQNVPVQSLAIRLIEGDDRRTM